MGTRSTGNQQDTHSAGGVPGAQDGRVVDGSREDETAKVVVRILTFGQVPEFL